EHAERESAAAAKQVDERRPSHSLCRSERDSGWFCSVCRLGTIDSARDGTIAVPPDRIPDTGSEPGPVVDTGRTTSDEGGRTGMGRRLLVRRVWGTARHCSFWRADPATATPFPREMLSDPE